MPRASGAGRSDENDSDQTSDVQCNRLPGCGMAGAPADLSGILPRGLLLMGIGCNSKSNLARDARPK